ncbi:hypothetical protein ACQP6V_08510 [Acinetobacter baumannii]|uniref:hypothetical protein n=1 Tax=Acinetobacter baumannii TaxID=470 RepID=UPI003D056D99
MSSSITAAEAAKIAATNHLSAEEILDQMNLLITTVVRSGNRVATKLYQKQAVDLVTLEKVKTALEELGYKVQINTDSPVVYSIQVEF